MQKNSMKIFGGTGDGGGEEKWPGFMLPLHVVVKTEKQKLLLLTLMMFWWQWALLTKRRDTLAHHCKQQWPVLQVGCFLK